MNTKKFNKEEVQIRKVEMETLFQNGRNVDEPLPEEEEDSEEEEEEEEEERNEK
jgi:hypothetical protein